MIRIFQCAWLRRLLVALGCLHLLGGPVAMLQVVAWAGMLVSYSAEDGLAKGVADTFSGERPCSLCLKVREIGREAPDPLHPPGEDRRRLAEALGQSMRMIDPIEVPVAKAGPGISSRRFIRNCNRPDDPFAERETPPPRRRA